MTDSRRVGEAHASSAMKLSVGTARAAPLPTLRVRNEERL